ncbi:hypothetical protein U1Q18_039378 [Sarracenia purpurea var. burkii]
MLKILTIVLRSIDFADIIRIFLKENEKELGLPSSKADESVVLLYDAVFTDVGNTKIAAGSEKDEFRLLLKEILKKFVELLEVSALNEAIPGTVKSVFKAWEQRLNSSEGHLESNEGDPELLVFILFTSDVKIKSISVVGGAHGTSPSKMRAYSHLFLSNFSDSVPTMLLDNLQNLLVDLRMREDQNGDQVANARHVASAHHNVMDRNPLIILFEFMLSWIDYGWIDHRSSDGVGEHDDQHKVV